MINSFRTSLVIISIAFLQSCKEKPVAPALLTNSITEISTTDAVSGGVITDDGGAPIISKGICWDISESPTIENSKTNELSQSLSFTSNLSQLTPKTTYFVKAYATNEAGTGYGKSVTFTTLGDKPISNAQNTSNIQLSSATLNGTVNPNSLTTTASFEWGTTTNYGNIVSCPQSPIGGNNPVNISADISGLAPGTTYYFRVKSENSLGATFSSDMTFKTLGAPPLATISEASNIRVRSSTLKGVVNANYLSSSVIFEWGTTISLGYSVNAIQNPVSGNEAVNISVDISDLLPGTTYYARIKAENSLGTTYSNNISFTTPEIEWAKTSDFPGEARCSPLAFTYNGKGYYGLGSNSVTGENLSDFWTFDPTSSTWARLNDCPFKFLNGLTSKCLVGSSLYVFKEWSLYSYNISLDTWEYLCNSGISLFSMSCFSINNKAFFFNKSNSELYEYDPVNKLFKKQNAIISGYANWLLNETFIINNEVFLIHKNNTKVEIYHYIAQSDIWEKKLEKPFSNPEFETASFIITIDNSAYIGQSTTFLMSSYDDNTTVTPGMPSSVVWKYDPLKNEFKQCVSLPGEFRAQTGCFSFENTGYVISGVTVDQITNKFKYLKDVWIMNR